MGGVQSGVQIAEDLVDSGRKVSLATRMVARIPRWYREIDIFYWLQDLNFFDVRAEEINDPQLLEMKPAQISGNGDGRKSLSL